VVVGQVPLVGSAAGMFCEQFETVWRQLRFVALAARIYGHDVEDDACQCQIILCLLDDKIRKRTGPGAMDRIYSGGVRSGVQVAATIIARQIIAKGGRSFVMRRVLGGLLVGVVPEAVGVLYTVLFMENLRSKDAQIAERARELNERARSHFKKDEQPGLTTVISAFLVWSIPLLGINVSKAWYMMDRLVYIMFFQTIIEYVETSPAIVQILLWFFFALLKSAVLLSCGFSAFLLGQSLLRSRTWLVSTIALGVRAALSFVSAQNTATSLGLAIMFGMENAVGDCLYHSHRAGVGLFTILSRSEKSLKTYNPYVVGSLLVWIVYNLATCLFAYAQAVAPLFLIGKDYNLEVAISDIQTLHAELANSGFAGARLRDALNALTTIALHVLLEELRRPEILMTVFGPKKVVTGMLFAAKSLGHVVASPESVLLWLDNVTPPVMVSRALLSASWCASSLGLICGLLLHFELVSKLNLIISCYAVLVTVPFYLAHKRMPPPHEDQDWDDALKSRHRLLYLIPDIDTGFRSKLYFAISFFEHYEFAMSRSQHYASSSFVKVKDWVQSNFTKREKQEFGRLAQTQSDVEPPLEFDAGVYYEESSWKWPSIRDIFSRKPNIELTIEDEQKLIEEARMLKNAREEDEEEEEEEECKEHVPDEDEDEEGKGEGELHEFKEEEKEESGKEDEVKAEHDEGEFGSVKEEEDFPENKQHNQEEEEEQEQNNPLPLSTNYIEERDDVSWLRQKLNNFPNLRGDPDEEESMLTKLRSNLWFGDGSEEVPQESEASFLRRKWDALPSWRSNSSLEEEEAERLVLDRVEDQVQNQGFLRRRWDALPSWRGTTDEVAVEETLEDASFLKRRWNDLPSWRRNTEDEASKDEDSDRTSFFRRRWNALASLRAEHQEQENHEEEQDVNKTN